MPPLANMEHMYISPSNTADEFRYAPALALVQARPSTLAWLEAPVAKRKKLGPPKGARIINPSSVPKGAKFG